MFNKFQKIKFHSIRNQLQSNDGFFAANNVKLSSHNLPNNDRITNVIFLSYAYNSSCQLIDVTHYPHKKNIKMRFVDLLKS